MNLAKKTRLHCAKFTCVNFQSGRCGFLGGGVHNRDAEPFRNRKPIEPFRLVRLVRLRLRFSIALEPNVGKLIFQ